MQHSLEFFDPLVLFRSRRIPRLLGLLHRRGEAVVGQSNENNNEQHQENQNETVAGGGAAATEQRQNEEQKAKMETFEIRIDTEVMGRFDPANFDAAPTPLIYLHLAQELLYSLQTAAALCPKLVACSEEIASTHPVDLFRHRIALTKHALAKAASDNDDEIRVMRDHVEFLEFGHRARQEATATAATKATITDKKSFCNFLHHVVDQQLATSSSSAGAAAIYQQLLCAAQHPGVNAPPTSAAVAVRLAALQLQLHLFAYSDENSQQQAPVEALQIAEGHLRGCLRCEGHGAPPAVSVLLGYVYQLSGERFLASAVLRELISGAPTINATVTTAITPALATLAVAQSALEELSSDASVTAAPADGKRERQAREQKHDLLMQLLCEEARGSLSPFLDRNGVVPGDFFAATKKQIEGFNMTACDDDYAAGELNFDGAAAEMGVRLRGGARRMQVCPHSHLLCSVSTTTTTSSGGPKKKCCSASAFLSPLIPTATLRFLPAPFRDVSLPPLWSCSHCSKSLPSFPSPSSAADELSDDILYCVGCRGTFSLCSACASRAVETRYRSPLVDSALSSPSSLVVRRETPLQMTNDTAVMYEIRSRVDSMRWCLKIYKLHDAEAKSQFDAECYIFRRLRESGILNEETTRFILERQQLRARLRTGKDSAAASCDPAVLRRLQTTEPFVSHVINIETNVAASSSSSSSSSSVSSAFDFGCIFNEYCDYLPRWVFDEFTRANAVGGFREFDCRRALKRMLRTLVQFHDQLHIGVGLVTPATVAIDYVPELTVRLCVYLEAIYEGDASGSTAAAVRARQVEDSRGAIVVWLALLTRELEQLPPLHEAGELLLQQRSRGHVLSQNCLDFVGAATRALDDAAAASSSSSSSSTSPGNALLALPYLSDDPRFETEDENSSIYESNFHWLARSAKAENKNGNLFLFQFDPREDDGDESTLTSHVLRAFHAETAAPDEQSPAAEHFFFRALRLLNNLGGGGMAAAQTRALSRMSSLSSCFSSAHMSPSQSVAYLEHSSRVASGDGAETNQHPEHSNNNNNNNNNNYSEILATAVRHLAQSLKLAAGFTDPHRAKAYRARTAAAAASYPRHSVWWKSSSPSSPRKAASSSSSSLSSSHPLIYRYASLREAEQELQRLAKFIEATSSFSSPTAALRRVTAVHLSVHSRGVRLMLLRESPRAAACLPSPCRIVSLEQICNQRGGNSKSDLRPISNAGLRLHELTAKEIVEKVLSACAHLHEAGVVAEAINSDNVLLCCTRYEREENQQDQNQQEQNQPADDNFMLVALADDDGGDGADSESSDGETGDSDENVIDQQRQRSGSSLFGDGNNDGGGGGAALYEIKRIVISLPPPVSHLHIGRRVLSNRTSPWLPPECFLLVALSPASDAWACALLLVLLTIPHCFPHFAGNAPRNVSQSASHLSGAAQQLLKRAFDIESDASGGGGGTASRFSSARDMLDFIPPRGEIAYFSEEATGRSIQQQQEHHHQSKRKHAADVYAIPPSELPWRDAFVEQRARRAPATPAQHDQEAEHHNNSNNNNFKSPSVASAAGGAALSTEDSISYGPEASGAFEMHDSGSEHLQNRNQVNFFSGSSGGGGGGLHALFARVKAALIADANVTGERAFGVDRSIEQLDQIVQDAIDALEDDDAAMQQLVNDPEEWLLGLIVKLTASSLRTFVQQQIHAGNNAVSFLVEGSTDVCFFSAVLAALSSSSFSSSSSSSPLSLWRMLRCTCKTQTAFFRLAADKANQSMLMLGGDFPPKHLARMRGVIVNDNDLRLLPTCGVTLSPREQPQAVDLTVHQLALGRAVENYLIPFTAPLFMLLKEVSMSSSSPMSSSRNQSRVAALAATISSSNLVESFAAEAVATFSKQFCSSDPAASCLAGRGWITDAVSQMRAVTGGAAKKMPLGELLRDDATQRFALDWTRRAVLGIDGTTTAIGNALAVAELCYAFRHLFADCAATESITPGNLAAKMREDFFDGGGGGGGTVTFFVTLQRWGDLLQPMTAVVDESTNPEYVRLTAKQRQKFTPAAFAVSLAELSAPFASTGDDAASASARAPPPLAGLARFSQQAQQQQQQQRQQEGQENQEDQNDDNLIRAFCEEEARLFSACLPDFLPRAAALLRHFLSSPTADLDKQRSWLGIRAAAAALLSHFQQVYFAMLANSSKQRLSAVFRCGGSVRSSDGTESPCPCKNLVLFATFKEDTVPKRHHHHHHDPATVDAGGGAASAAVETKQPKWTLPGAVRHHPCACCAHTAEQHGVGLRAAAAAVATPVAPGGPEAAEATETLVDLCRLGASAFHSHDWCKLTTGDAAGFFPAYEAVTRNIFNNNNNNTGSNSGNNFQRIRNHQDVANDFALVAHVDALHYLCRDENSNDDGSDDSASALRLLRNDVALAHGHPALRRHLLAKHSSATRIDLPNWMENNDNEENSDENRQVNNNFEDQFGRNLQYELSRAFFDLVRARREEMEKLKQNIEFSLRN